MIGGALIGVAVCGLLMGWGWMHLSQAEAQRALGDLQAHLGTERHRTGAIARARSLFAGTRLGQSCERILREAHLPYQALDLLVAVIAVWVGLVYASKTAMGLSTGNAIVTASVSLIFAIRTLRASRRGWFFRTFNQQLPEVAWILGNAMRAGLTVQQGLEVVGREAPHPARMVFSQMVAELNLNHPLGEALEDLQARLSESRELRLLVLTILIQHRSGGNMAKALEALAHTLAERKGINEEVASSTAGARSTAVILPFMPLLCTGIMNAVIPGFLNSLFTSWGLVLLVPFLVMQWLAYKLISNFADIKV